MKNISLPNENSVTTRLNLDKIIPVKQNDNNYSLILTSISLPNEMCNTGMWLNLERHLPARTNVNNMCTVKPWQISPSQRNVKNCIVQFWNIFNRKVWWWMILLHCGWFFCCYSSIISCSSQNKWNSKLKYINYKKISKSITLKRCLHSSGIYYQFIYH